MKTPSIDGSPDKRVDTPMSAPTDPAYRSDAWRETGTTAETSSAPARPPSRRRSKQAVAAPTDRPGGARDVILVGCGPLAQQMFIPALVALEHDGAIAVRAVVDSSEPARELCRKTFPRVAPLASFEAVVCPPDALAIVTTPARFHAAQASSALKRGWHVLCANPFATTAHEGALMIAAADRQERLLAVDLPHRFFPAVRYLRTLCRDHLLGPLINFRIHEGTSRRPAAEAMASEKFESPDGVLHELGVSIFDLLTWCLGAATVKTYADDAMGGVEANAFLELTFSEGARGTVHLSRDWSTEQSYTFVFERGIVRWMSPQPGRLTVHVASAPFAVDGELVTPLSAGHSHPVLPQLASPEQALIAQLQNVLGAISGRESLRVAANEAMHSLSLVEECYARRTPLPQPWLPQQEAVQARASAPPMALRRS